MARSQGSDKTGCLNDDSRSPHVTSKQTQSGRGKTGAERLALYCKKALALFMTPIKAAVNYRVLGL